MDRPLDSRALDSQFKRPLGAAAPAKNGSEFASEGYRIAINYDPTTMRCELDGGVPKDLVIAYGMLKMAERILDTQNPLTIGG